MLNNNPTKLFREENLPQGSEVWLGWREKHLGASEIGILTGDNFFSSPRDLWLLKTKRCPPISANADMLRGKRLEPEIRQLLETTKKIRLEQFCLEHLTESHLSASLDGFDEKNGIFWEIKAPRVETQVKLYKQQKIPRWYRAQMLQQQMILESHCGKNISGFFASYVSDEALRDYYGTDRASDWHAPRLIILPFAMCRIKENLLTRIASDFWQSVVDDCEPRDFPRRRELIFNNQWRWS